MRAELAGLEVRIVERLRQQTMWMVGTLIAGLGLVSGLAALL